MSTDHVRNHMWNSYLHTKEASRIMYQLYKIDKEWWLKKRPGEKLRGMLQRLKGDKYATTHSNVQN